jgi:sugar phosphate isomerase/epimerase
MNTLAISQLSTLRWSIQEDAEAYSQRGFGGIGIYRPKLEDFGIDRTVELLADYELAVTSLSWVGGFTGSDGRGYDEAVSDAIDAVKDAANLQADTLIVLAGGRNNHIRTHARKTLCKALKSIAKVAEDYDIRISLEPIHPGCGEEWSFLNDLQSTLDIIETVKSSSLGMVLDTYHVGMDEEALRWLPDVMPHLHLVQLGDARHSPHGEMNRCLLGQGCVPIRDILQILASHQFKGPLEVELIGEDIEPLSYDQVLDHTKDYVDALFGPVKQD